MKISTLLVGFLVLIQTNAEAAKVFGARERDGVNTKTKDVLGSELSEDILSLKAEPRVVRDAIAKRSSQILELAKSIRVSNPQIVTVALRLPHIVTLMALMESNNVSNGLKKTATDFLEDLASSPFKISDNKESLRTLNSILEKAPGMQDSVERLLKAVLNERLSGDSLAVSFDRVMKKNARDRNMELDKYLEEVFNCKV